MFFFLYFKLVFLRLIILTHIRTLILYGLFCLVKKKVSKIPDWENFTFLCYNNDEQKSLKMVETQQFEMNFLNSTEHDNNQTLSAPKYKQKATIVLLVSILVILILQLIYGAIFWHMFVSWYENFFLLYTKKKLFTNKG